MMLLMKQNEWYKGWEVIVYVKCSQMFTIVEKISAESFYIVFWTDSYGHSKVSPGVCSKTGI